MRRLPIVEEVTPNRPRDRVGRTRTIHPTRITLSERARLRELYPYDPNVVRPASRRDCADGPRPCPFVGCRWHLYLDVVEKTGAIRLNFPGLDVDELKESCALDVADRGGIPLEAIGDVMSITRERVRQIEVRALDKLAVVDGFLDLVRTGLEE